MNAAAVSDPKGDQAMMAGRPKDGFEVVMECRFWRKRTFANLPMSDECLPEAEIKDRARLRKAVIRWSFARWTPRL